jgi:SAM-dependent methyltransferase
LRWIRDRLGSVHGKLVHSRRVEVLARHFAELIPHSHSVLDVGCGDGLVSTLLSMLRPDLRLTGVEVLVRPGALITVSEFDGCHLPFGDHSWDTVLFCDVLHHAADPLGLLREAVRVARQCVLIKDHMVEGVLAGPTLRLMDIVGNVPHGVALPYNYLRPEEWRCAFADTGLAQVEIRRALHLYPWPLDLVFGRTLHFLGRFETQQPLS